MSNELYSEGGRRKAEGGKRTAKVRTPHKDVRNLNNMTYSWDPVGGFGKYSRASFGLD